MIPDFYSILLTTPHACMQRSWCGPRVVVPYQSSFGLKLEWITNMFFRFETSCSKCAIANPELPCTGSAWTHIGVILAYSYIYMLYVVIAPPPILATFCVHSYHTHIHFRQTGSHSFSCQVYVFTICCIIYFRFHVRAEVFGSFVWSGGWRGCWIDHWMSIIMLYPTFPFPQSCSFPNGLRMGTYLPTDVFFFFFFF